MATGNKFIDTWAAAIKQHEGWVEAKGKNKGSISFRNNNPGNIRGLVKGAVGIDAKRFAIFPSVEEGQKALERDLIYKANAYRDKSLLQIMSRYLGGTFENPKITSEGDPFAYAKVIASKLNVGIDTKLGDLYTNYGGSSSFTGDTLTYAQSKEVTDAEYANEGEFFECLTSRTREAINNLKQVIAKLDNGTNNKNGLLRAKIIAHPKLTNLIQTSPTYEAT